MTIRTTSSLVRDLKIFTSTLTALPLALTTYRLFRRCVMRRFWWEDACAVIALMSSIACVVSSWPNFDTLHASSTISFWIHTITYPTVIWSVRLSILFSLLRILSPLLRLRRATIIIAVLFVLMWSSLMVSFVVTCVVQRNATLGSSYSVKRQLVAIFELIADILSDTTLIGLPIYSLRYMKLQRLSQRRLIITAYSSNVIVSVLSCLRATCQLLNIPLLIVVAVDVQVACSLFVCNSLFFSILVYRLFLCRSEDEANADNTSFHSPGSAHSIPQLTTIDLDAFVSMMTISGGVLTLPPPTHEDSEKFCQDTPIVPRIKHLEQ